ncbi:MAG TPA: sulfite exporter TauE/SafE family protein, partial [Desulfatirhabdiaceae bacterium]|nr:sulfite exporter TauE/SafE family protein [Desulfatirhabdiaceae bacterium]
MNHNMKFFIIFAVLSFLVASPFIIPDAAYADKLTDAIAKTPVGTEKGQIDTKAEPGYLGIPGGPKVNLVVAFLWAVWVGWIFSTVGAFGGIMAGVGHITVFKLGAYAGTFKDSSPMLNKVVTDSIRVSNQFLVGMSALITSIKYYQLGRLVLPLGVALAVGSISGSYLVPLLTAGKVSFKAYQGYFGLFVLLLGCWMLYETTPMGQASKKKAKQAADAFEKTMKEQRSGANVDTKSLGVKVTGFTATKFSFTFYGVEFSFNPWYPVIGGFVIACIASFIGVGGGFLLVPFLTSISGLPMFLAAGTSALAVLIGMITSIISYLQQGVIVHWSLIGLEMVGIVVGSLVGPTT